MNKRETGSRYEEMAAEFLEQKGCRILEKNYRTRNGEIDLILMDGRYLVFAEVKYRKDDRKGTALEAVDWRKQQIIRRVAAEYLYRHHCRADQPCRFDVIGITGDVISHIKNAF